MNCNQSKMYENKIILAICTIFSLRMFGMFMIIPVLSTYGMLLKNSNMFLIGVAIGIYGLFQALLQIPYGWLSDKFGRKIVIIIGLLFFFLGNVISWKSSSIWGVIIGRSFQGIGAISSVLMTLLSDLVEFQSKMKAMGLLGISFGISFLSAIILGPVIVNMFGFHSLFLINLFLSMLCIFIVIFFIPSISIDKKSIFDVKTEIKNFLVILRNNDLLQINLSIFIIHFFLMCSFIVVPVELKNLSQCFVNIPWILYLIVVLMSFLIAFGVIYFTKNNSFFINFTIKISIFLFMLSNIIFLCSGHRCLFLLFGLQIFFLAFIFFETILPILVNKNSPLDYKGTAMAVYSTSQFLGSAVGGIVGGILFSHFSFFEISLLECIITVIWFTLNIKSLNV